MNFFRRFRAVLGRLRSRRRGPHVNEQDQRNSVRVNRADRTQDQASHRVGRPGLGPMPNTRALITEARSRGQETARSGAIDWWMFGADLVLPYVRELRHRREIALNVVRYRARNLERWDEAELHDNRSAARKSRLEQTRLEEQLTTKREHVQAAWSEINRLAQRDVERDRANSSLIDDDDLAGLDIGADLGDDPADQLAPPGPQAADGPAVQAVWPGLHATRIPRWLTVCILGGLIAVELPIQYVIFKRFEQFTTEGEFLTWAFTIPVSAVMVLLPHLAGWLYRGRAEVGAERLMRLLPLLLLVPWAYLASMLGYLRARVLLVKPSLPQGFFKIPSPAQALHITPATVTVMFVVLILGVGGIGFLLGLAREHPLAASYTGAEEAQQHVARQLQDVAAAAQLAEDRAAASKHEPRRSDLQLEERLAAVSSVYLAAEQAYLDALITSLGDPAISEAVARMVAQLEGQPPADLAGPR